MWIKNCLGKLITGLNFLTTNTPNILRDDEKSKVDR